MSEQEVRLDQINYKGHLIKTGHPVRVLPTKKGGRDGFDTLVKGFRGVVITDDESGTRRGRVSGIEVSDPKGATRFLGPERIVPYLRNVEQKAASLRERHKVVPIKAAAIKKTAAATEAAKTTGQAQKAAGSAKRHPSGS
jgi:hypothetical protein